MFSVSLSLLAGSLAILAFVGCAPPPTPTPPTVVTPLPPVAPRPTSTLPATPEANVRPAVTPPPVLEDPMRFVRFVAEARELFGERAALQQEFDRIADAGRIQEEAAALRALADRATALQKRAQALSAPAEAAPVRALLVDAVGPQADALLAAATYAETGSPAAKERMTLSAGQASRAWATAADGLRELATRYHVSLEAR